MQIGKFPRIRAAALPTPFEEMTGLRAALNITPRIFIKRDDNTGLAIGGNKARKLEFLMAEAAAQRADIVITTGGAQSNHARMTAAFARKIGMKPVLVFDSDDPGRRQGNLLLDTIMGADLVFGGEGADTEALMEKAAEGFRAQGRRPYIIPLGGSTPLGALGFVNAMYELIGQANDLRIAVTDVYVASGSAGTQGGLVLGSRLMGGTVGVRGVGVSASVATLPERVAAIANGAARLLGTPVTVLPEEVTAYDQYVGAGYGIPTQTCLEAIRLVARTEGIILDPVYTGKAMAGFLDRVRGNMYAEGECVVFWHTGGTPALFAQEEHFQVS
jgi:D-cysteine desulfhydrase family pyridoxal phosphate-dependent enzyme